MNKLDEEILQTGLTIAYHRNSYHKEVSDNLYPKGNFDICFTPDPLYLANSSHFVLMNRFEKRLRILRKLQKILNWFKSENSEEVSMRKFSLEKEIEFEQDLVTIYRKLVDYYQSGWFDFPTLGRSEVMTGEYKRRLKKAEKRLRRLQMIKKVKDWFAKIFSDEEIVIPQVPVEDTARITVSTPKMPARKASKKTETKKATKKAAKKASKKTAKKSSSK